MMRKKMLPLLLCFFATTLFADIQKNHRLSVRGGIASSSVAFVGPVVTANLKLSFGADYWFNEHWFLGGDIGLGGEGFGKAIGVTQASVINLKNGAFLFDPGVSGGYAFYPWKRVGLYPSMRLGVPLRSGYPGALSLGAGFGSLIELTDSVDLDVALNCSVTANFKFNYLATILSIGSLGFRVYL